MTANDLEEHLAGAVEHELTNTLSPAEMALRLAPFSPAMEAHSQLTDKDRLDNQMQANQRMPNVVPSGLSSGQKRSMVPVEHFGESLMSLDKALTDLKSLRTKLIGEPPLAMTTNAVPRPGSDGKRPVVAVLHEQAAEVARLAVEISSVVAMIRDKL